MKRVALIAAVSLVHLGVWWIVFITIAGFEERLGGRPWLEIAAIGLFVVLCLPLLIPLGGMGLSDSLMVCSVVLNSIAAGWLLVAAGRHFLQARSRRAVRKHPRPVVGAAFLLVLFASSGYALEDARASTVGIPAHITDLVLPGGELEVLPQDAKTAVVLRITRRPSRRESGRASRAVVHEGRGVAR